MSRIDFQTGSWAAEAVCSAFHQTDFTFVGEQGASTWFMRGDPTAGKAIRVEVQRPIRTNHLFVIVTYPSNRLGSFKIATQELSIDLSGGDAAGTSLHMQVVAEATKRAVVRVLEVFRSVLDGTS